MAVGVARGRFGIPLRAQGREHRKGWEGFGDMLCVVEIRAGGGSVIELRLLCELYLWLYLSSVIKFQLCKF